MKIFKYDVRLKTFLKKGLPKIDDRFGVYFVTGKQGSGKSYYAVYLLLSQNLSIINKVYTNMHSLEIPYLKEHTNYFRKITELYDNVDDYSIFIIDEISKKYHRNSPTDKDFYAWLNQSRKRKRIVILITQEWRELPMWIRRPAKYMIATKPTKILNLFGIFSSTVGDAENMIFNKDEGEYECPPIKTIVYKRNETIASYYDTFEAITDL